MFSLKQDLRCQQWEVIVEIKLESILQVEVKDDKTTIVHAYPRLASWDQRCILVWMEWDIWQGVSMRSFCSNSGNRRVFKLL